MKKIFTSLFLLLIAIKIFSQFSPGTSLLTNSPNPYFGQNLGVTLNLKVGNKTGIGISAALEANMHIKTLNALPGDTSIFVENNLNVDQFYLLNSGIAYLANSLGIGVAPAEQLQITKNFRFPATTGSTIGNFLLGTDRIFSNYKPAGTNDNLFWGRNSGNYTLAATSNFNANVGYGQNTLQTLTTGYFNTAIGGYAGEDATTGFENTYIGLQAGRNFSTGNYNTAIGSSALFGTGSNSGSENVAIGRISANLLTTGGQNTFIGNESGEVNSTGGRNIYIGYKAGEDMTTGSDNIIIGVDINNASLTGNGQLIIGSVYGGDLVTGIPKLPGTLATDNNNLKVLAKNSVSTNIEEVELSAIIPQTFYSGDGAFSGDRTVTGNEHYLHFNDFLNFQLNTLGSATQLLMDVTTWTIGDDEGGGHSYISGDVSTEITEVGSTNTLITINGTAETITFQGDEGFIFNNVQEFTDNADAISNGLATGAIYRTGDDLKIVH